MERIAEKGQRRKPGVSEEWIWIFQRRLRELARNPRLQGSHWRVLAYVISCATFAQDITLRQRDIGAALGIAQSTVSLALQDLHRCGVLLRVDTGGYPATYRFNSAYVYKGRGERLEQRRAYQGKEGSHRRG